MCSEPVAATMVDLFLALLAGKLWLLQGSSEPLHTHPGYIDPVPEQSGSRRERSPHSPEFATGG